MPAHIAISLWRQRIAAGLLGIFGLLALGLVSIGVYGVVSHSVVQRTREIGIRMAIGARPGQVRALAIRGAFVWIGAGLVAGIPGAVFTGVLMQKGIPGLRSFDFAAVAATLLLLAAVGLAAAYFPARRAARVDPLLALRAE